LYLKSLWVLGLKTKDTWISKQKGILISNSRKQMTTINYNCNHEGHIFKFLFKIACFNQLLLNNNNTNIYTALTAPSFMFGKPNRIQRPRKRRYATSAKTDWNKNVFNACLKQSRDTDLVTGSLGNISLTYFTKRIYQFWSTDWNAREAVSVLTKGMVNCRPLLTDLRDLVIWSN